MTSTIKYDLDGSDPRTVDELKDALESCMHDWPGVAPRRVRCDRMPKNTYGSTNNAPMHGYGPGEDVAVSRSAMKDMTKWQQAIRQVKVDGTSGMNERVEGWIEQHPAAYTIEHEFGHVLFAHIYGNGSEPVGDDACRRLQLVAWRAAGVGEARGMGTDSVPLFFIFGLGQQEIHDGLSPYAVTSPMEMMAEAFAIQRVLGKGANKIADAVMEQVRKDYEAKYHHRPKCPVCGGHCGSPAA